MAAATTQVDQDRNALNLLVGAPVDEALLPTTLAGLETQIATPPVGLSSSVLLARPDVVQAEHTLKSANYSVALRARPSSPPSTSPPRWALPADRWPICSSPALRGGAWRHRPACRWWAARVSPIWMRPAPTAIITPRFTKRRCKAPSRRGRRAGPARHHRRADRRAGSAGGRLARQPRPVGRAVAGGLAGLSQCADRAAHALHRAPDAGGRPACRLRQPPRALCGGGRRWLAGGSP
jgi:hypothetical protein